MRVQIRARLDALNAPPVKPQEEVEVSPPVTPIEVLPEKPAAPPKKERKISATTEEMRLLRIQGKTYKEIGAQFGCTAQGVINRLKRFNLKNKDKRIILAEKTEALGEFLSDRQGYLERKGIEFIESISKADLLDTKAKDRGDLGLKLLEQARKERTKDMESPATYHFTIRAAYPTPKNEPTLVGNQVPELPGGIRGIGLSEDVGEKDLPEVPRDGELGNLNPVRSESAYGACAAL